MFNFIAALLALICLALNWFEGLIEIAGQMINIKCISFFLLTPVLII